MKRYSPLFVFKAVKKIHRKTGELVTDIAMGLPLSHYTDANLKELVPLLQRIEVGREVLELNARFYPQGLGVLADYRLSQAGDVNARTDHDMIILDIGFNTVDIIVVERGRIVKGESDTLERLGCRRFPGPRQKSRPGCSRIFPSRNRRTCFAKAESGCTAQNGISPNWSGIRRRNTWTG